MRRAVIVMLDGLRRDFIASPHTPRLCALARLAESFAAHRSVFPSATRVVASTVATGCFPAKHGLQGNTMALLEGGRLVAHDAGSSGFLQYKRAVTGASLAMPTLAQRLAASGGSVVFSNVSPGAAYALDPDGFGHVYHRAGSFGPGRIRLDALPVSLDAEGDRTMTARFVAALRPGRGPSLAVLWTGEPDHIQHSMPLGSPEHLAVLAAADRNAGSVIDAVAALREAGDDTLLLVGSDHGHETVVGVIDVEGELVAAGLKAGPDSVDVIALSNGTASLVYVHPENAGRCPSIEDFLRTRPWAGEVLGALDLAVIGQSTANGLAFAVSLRATAAANGFGVAGSALAALPRDGKPDRLGCGQHGGTGAFEQAPFLMAEGPGFAAGAMRRVPSSAVDLAPTVLRHLGLPEGGMDGRALQVQPPVALG